MAKFLIRLTDGRVLQARMKKGLNKLGRSPSSDVPIPDSTVSVSHCEIEWGDDHIKVRDLDSTNGTYIDGGLIQEAVLSPGQPLQLGGVQVELDLQAPEPEQSGFIPLPRSPGLTIRQTPWREQALAQADRSTTALPMAPRRPVPVAATAAPVQADAHCCSHPRVQARHFCPSCSAYYCDMCVGSDTSGGGAVAVCRQCGAPCSRVSSPEKRRAVSAAKGFFGLVPEAFTYPLRGNGSLILVGVTLFLSVLQALPLGVLGLIFGIVALGYTFSFMQGIIHTTAVGDNQMPDAPGLDGILAGCLQLAGTLIASFLPAFALEVAVHLGQPIPEGAITIAYILGCVYFPMAFLVVAIKDTLLAVIPTEVLPAIWRTWRSYLPMTILVMVVFFAGQIGAKATAGIAINSFSSASMGRLFAALAFFIFWNFMTLYLLTVNMRVLGLFYRTHQAQLGWFRRS